MNIIITMAGHSRRFHEADYSGPKALLMVGNRRMIEHVVNMFDPKTCQYHIVVNRHQLEDKPDICDYLIQQASRVSVTVVDPHELGPVYSALQVETIDADEEVIISYCDFLVEWSYPLFLRHVEGSDGGIVSFKGFHPASFGESYYAYMLVDAEDHMLALREKHSFTKTRHEEPASAGIYYFKNWAMFRHFGERILQKESRQLPEAYVSLLYNDMVSEGLEVTVHEAQKFICLGTPSDLAQYQHWWRYFCETPDIGDALEYGDGHRACLIPMAGQGSRFRTHGYRVAKALIPVRGIPMVIRASKSIPPQSDWTFLVRQEDLDRHPIERTLREFEPNCNVLGVDGVTSGQAATCMLAADFVDDESQLLIASCDYETLFDPVAWRGIVLDETIDGAVWTVKTKSLPVQNPSAFAYCEVGIDGRTITTIVEKATISDTPSLDALVVGTFWYRRARDFKRGALHLIENDITINGEHYVGTSINHLIGEGARFVVFEVEQWVSFGNPFELQVMEYWDDYFASAKQ